MFSFQDFLTENFLTETTMSGSFAQTKGRSHVLAYVMPFLSKEQKKNVLKNSSQHFEPGDIDVTKHGDFHDPAKNATTHEIESKTGHKDASSGKIYPQGTKVKVVGIKHDPKTKQIIAQTASHGDMPLSRLGKPKELARIRKTEEGFNVEKILQQRIDPRYKPAGSSGASWDFVAGDPDEEDKSVRGKAVKKDESKIPIFRGESKAAKQGNDSISMGTSTVKFNPESRTWSFAKKPNGPAMAKVFEKAVHPKTGLPVLEHLNKHNSNGNIPQGQGFTAKAPEGTAEHYMKSMKANSLHLHRYAADENGKTIMSRGTSYTVGDDNPFANKLGMGHLSYKDLGALDGSITIESSKTGSTTARHKPSTAVFKRMADASMNDPENHRDLTNEDHANEFRKRLTDHLSSLKNVSQETISKIPFVRKPFQTKAKTRPGEGEVSPMVTAPKPGLNPDAQHGRHSFYTPQEKTLMKGL